MSAAVSPGLFKPADNPPHFPKNWHRRANAAWVRAVVMAHLPTIRAGMAVSADRTGLAKPRTD
jgi:hypothetical protein